MTLCRINHYILVMYYSPFFPPNNISTAPIKLHRVAVIEPSILHHYRPGMVGNIQQPLLIIIKTELEFIHFGLM